jgi:hypothetical protein
VIASTKPPWASLVTRATPVRPCATRSRKNEKVGELSDRNRPDVLAQPAAAAEVAAAATRVQVAPSPWSCIRSSSMGSPATGSSRTRSGHRHHRARHVSQSHSRRGRASSGHESQRQSTRRQRCEG